MTSPVPIDPAPTAMAELSATPSIGTTSATPSGTASGAPGQDPVIQAWQQALAAEHTAVWGYGVLGPRLTATADVTSARAAQDAHDEIRATAIAGLMHLGVTPVAAQASYQLPYPVSTPAAARRYALSLEEAGAAAWRYVIAVAASPSSPAALTGQQLQLLRTTALTNLTTSAVRATGWRQLLLPSKPTVAFPGI